MALAEHHAAPEELNPLLIASGCEVISAQDPVQVTGNCGTDPGQVWRHWFSLVILLLTRLMAR
jgi:hypothetical protein